MIEDIFKMLHIKANPNKFLTIVFYGLTVFILVVLILRMLGFLIGDPRIPNDITPYEYAFFFLMPVLGLSYLANSGISKDDKQRIQAYIVTCLMLALMVGAMAAQWISNIVWWLIEKQNNYQAVLKAYPELFSPAIKTLVFIVPFISIFKVIDYFLLIYREEDYSKSIAAFSGLNAKSVIEETGPFACSTIICKQKGTSLPIIVPEKKRYESTLVQGTTGTGKTQAVLLPMSALDLEKKYFLREYSKKIGYAMLKRGIAYLTGPYDNDYINREFTLSFLSPKRGMEEQFFNNVQQLIQYKDNATGKVVYRNLGITVVENDGKFISDFIAVANNFSLEVLSVDPSNIENTLSINPFAIEEPTKVASIIADVLKSMYENEGGGAPGDPFFTQVTLDAFQNLAILLKEMYPILNNGEIASLEDMLEMLYSFDKVEYMCEEMKKIPALEQKYRLLIAYFERNFYKPSLNINGYEIPGTKGSGRKDTERFLYGAITQLNNLLRNPGLRKALCGKTNILQFDKALEEGSIITACSRKGELGIIQSKAFGMFFILQFQDSVLRRKGNEDSRTPHFLYIDEFPEYINKDMEVMFTLFRKYRCGVTVAIQNLSQLEKGSKTGSYYRQTVLANTKTQIVFGDTVPEDSEYWEKAFGKDKVPDKTTSYDLTSGVQKKISLRLEEKVRAKGYKIQNLGFGDVYYKTKKANGKTEFGQGKVSFLNSKYKSKFPVAMFNFEKYMMEKPEGPTINLNNSDTTDNDDQLLGAKTTTRLMEEIAKETQNNSASALQDDRYANLANKVRTPIGNDFEIIFEENEEPKLDNAKKDGGAITESYETPGIKKLK